MRLATIGLLLVLGGLLGGCSGGIDISGEGDITSSSGAYNCASEYAPCEFTNTAAIQETFTATPREGWQFDYWENCQIAKGNTCEIDVSAEIVSELFGRKLPPLTAHFKPASDTSLKLETLNTVVKSCDSSPILPRERHCALIEGREGGVSVRPDYKTLTIYYIDNLPYEGEYLVLDDGWTFAGRYIFTENGEEGATHSMVAQRTGDRIVASKWIVGSEYTYYMRFIMEVTQ